MVQNIINLVFVFSAFLISGRDEIDFEHKSLFKTLRKIEKIENIKLEEIKLSKSTDRPQGEGGKFFSVKKPGRIRYVYIGRVNSCRAGGCSDSRETIARDEFEYFDYFILFDSKGAVQEVKVFNYQATHGQEITARGWLRQFTGFDGSQPLDIGKSIDAISGATISVYAITLDIQTRIEILKSQVVQVE